MNINLGWKKKVLDKIKVSDLLAELLVANGINHVFIVSGGASIHLLHSFESTQGISPVPMHHEQAAAMAADGYARAGGGLGCAAATSGPGATNLITGIAGAWFDSIPCLFISGQVATFRLKGKLKVRQLGFQETEIVPMVRKITKFAIQIKRKIDVVSNTQLAIDVAKAPRPGPVLIDIPDDIQRDYIEKSPVSRLVDNMVVEGNFIQTIILNNKIKHINELIKASSRPLIIFGAGANYSEIEESCKKLVDTLGIPTLVTWRAKDLISSDCKYLIGTFGTHGTRAGNFIVQNSDLVIVLGSRLSSRETGGNLRDWARNAKLVHIDIDKFESKKLQKQGKEPILVVNADLRKFIPDLLNSLPVDLPLSRFTKWTSWAQEVKSKFEYRISDQESSSLSGYDFYLILNQYIGKSEQIFLDTGCTVAWAMQCFHVTDSMKLFHDCNNTAMGWALPAAIGGAIRNPLISTTCIAGDGSFMMNLQELSTSKLYSPNLKIIILNNSGYGMVRQTEDQWLSGKHIGTDQRNGDIIFPDFCKLAESFGLNSFKAKDQRELRSGLKSMYIDNNINLLEVMIDPSSKVVPQSRFGYPIEDSEPALSLMDMEENMLIPLLPISKESRL
jgi:acetolactate synthase-1/2/3 large subunit